MLHEIPTALMLLLSGSKRDAEGYLTRAVAAAPRFARLRWDLATFYREREQWDLAREHAAAVVAMTDATDQWAWRQQLRRRAQHLLEALPPPERAVLP